MKVRDYIDRRSNKTVYLIRHCRDGTLDMQEYQIDQIPKYELNQEVGEVVYENDDNSVEIYIM